MRINPETLENLALILHAFEDPDSEVPYLQGDERFLEELGAYKGLYKNLSQQRKKSLKSAVVWLLAQKVKGVDDEKIESLVPELYRKMWMHEGDAEATEEIIGELDTGRYAKAMRYIFAQVDIQDRLK